VAIRGHEGSSRQMTSKETVTEPLEEDDTGPVPVKTQPIMYGFTAVISTFLTCAR
jgi:hypothetical protein